MSGDGWKCLTLSLLLVVETDLLNSVLAAKRVTGLEQMPSQDLLLGAWVGRRMEMWVGGWMDG